MSSKGFTQLVQVPTHTDSGTLLNHVYYNLLCTLAITDSICEDTYIDVMDTYYSDHDAVYVSLVAHVIPHFILLG